ncbi:MAG: hypothetical protein V4598_01430 [Bdellovibrionota bacterium]
MKSLFLICIFLFSGSTWARHFVLVAGLNNEQVSAYFTSFENYLKSRGHVHITKISPSSLNTVSENKAYLRRKLLEAFELHQEPLTIFAHSKGSLETAHTLATYPQDFPAEIVERAVYANTPFQGSPYMPESIRKFEEQWGNFGNQYNPVYLNAVRVMKSLLTENILALKLTDDSLSERTYFVRTTKDAHKVSVILKDSAEFLRAHGPNDGLIPADNQMMNGFGRDLGIFKGIDHTDFFVRKWNLDSPTSKVMDEIFFIID